MNTAAPNIATTATGPVTIGNVNQTTTLNGTVSFSNPPFGSGVNLAMNTAAPNIATSANGAVTIGTGSQSLGLQGSGINFYGPAYLPPGTTVSGITLVSPYVSNTFANLVFSGNVGVASALTTGNVEIGTSLVTGNVVLGPTVFRGAVYGLAGNSAFASLGTTATGQVAVGTSSNGLALYSSQGTFVWPVTSYTATTSAVQLNSSITPTCKIGDILSVNLVSPATYNGTRTVTGVTPTAVTFSFAGSAGSGAASGSATMNTYQLSMFSNGDIWLGSSNATLVPSNLYVYSNLAVLGNVTTSLNVTGNVTATKFFGDGSALTNISGSGFTASSNFFGNATSLNNFFGNASTATIINGSTITFGTAPSGSGANLSKNLTANNVATNATATVNVGTLGQQIVINGPAQVLSTSAGNLYLGGPSVNTTIQNTTGSVVFQTVGSSSVTVGNSGLPLNVNGTSVTMAGNLTVSGNIGVATANTSIVGSNVNITGPIYGNGQSLSMNTSANQLATTATGPVLIGNTSYNANIVGGNITLYPAPGVGIVNLAPGAASVSIGTGVTSSISIGSGTPTVSIQSTSVTMAGNLTVTGNIGVATANTSIVGSNVNITGPIYGNGQSLSMNTSANQLATTATGPVLIGNTSYNANIVGGNITLYPAPGVGIVNLAPGAASVSIGTGVTSSISIGSGTPTVSIQSTSVTMAGNLTVTGNIGVATANTAIVGSNVLVGSATTNVFVGASGGNVFVQGVLNPVGFGGCLSDETTTLTVANQISIRAPYGFTIRQNYPPRWSLNVLPTATTPVTFDLQKNGNSIYTSGNQPTIGSTAISNTSISGTLIGGSNTVVAGDLLVAKVLALGSGTPAGAKVFIFSS